MKFERQFEAFAGKREVEFLCFHCTKKRLLQSHKSHNGIQFSHLFSPAASTLMALFETASTAELLLFAKLHFSPFLFAFQITQNCV